MSQAPVVSVIIPAFNKWEYTFKCLFTLLQNTQGVEYETIVIDNASSDDTPAGLPMLEGVRVHRNEVNLGFARACNQGAQLAKGKYLLFLNNDTEPQPDWLLPMVQIVEADPTVAMVGSKLLFPDGTIQHGGVGFIYGAPYPISPVHIHYRKPAEASQQLLELNAVTAACFLIRREVFEKLGGFDEGFVNGYEDIDLCLRVRQADGRIIYTPDSVVIHHESVSDGRFSHTDQNIVRLHQKWLGQFEAFDVDQRTTRWVNEPGPSRPRQSVVVAMRDALSWAAPSVEGIFENLGPDDELVVVDNGSTDSTSTYLQLFAAEHRGVVRIITLSAAVTEGEALRAGLTAARHDMATVASTQIRMQVGCLDKLAAIRDEAKVDAVTLRRGGCHHFIFARRDWLMSRFGAADARGLGGAKLATIEEVLPGDDTLEASR